MAHQLNEFNKLVARFLRWRKVIGVIRGLILATVVVTVWAYLRPTEGIEQLLIGLVSFVIAFWSSANESSTHLEQNVIKIALDIKHPEISSDPFSRDNLSGQEWQKVITEELNASRKEYNRFLLNYCSTVVLPILLLIAISFAAPSGMTTAFSNASRAVANFSWGVSLQILQGNPKNDGNNMFALSRSKIVELELTTENLIELSVTRSLAKDEPPMTMELRKKVGDKEELFQSFQIGHDTSSSDTNASSFKLSFSISESVLLYIPEISSSPLANITVKSLPYPEVRIATPQVVEDPWPDDQPLKIDINTHAEHLLKLVRLVILSGKKRSEELVSNVLATDLADFNSTYDIVLSPYVESDIADVEIYAEVIDRSIPTPLIGRSNSITLKTSSAYGRYRQTLETLRELKVVTDKALQSGQGSLNGKSAELIATAEKRAATSPYFDGLDRVTIDELKAIINDIIASQNLETLGDLTEKLNNFLAEHEMLDDRERDRDFFVAVRSLSRILEKDPEQRNASFSKAAERLMVFLDDRHARWEARVNRLEASFRPKSWPAIKSQKPFHKQIDKVIASDATNNFEARQQGLVLLGQSSADFRSWIEELEKQEDLARQAAESKRQEGLASARNALRELQQRQGEISQTLDRASSKEKGALSDEWPALRAKQNGNLNGTKELEGQLRSLAPSAGERIKLAADAMQLNLDSGNAANFDAAESASDLAGRLLRQAESAAQKAQQGSGQRPRRFTPSDQYFGQTVAGDIEVPHGYEVDVRYRQAILDEAQKSLNNGEYERGTNNGKVLEEYLRQIIR